MSEQPTLFMTWLWHQNPPRHDFNAEKVNRWAEQLRRNLSIPHVLACVTKHPEGIDPSIMIIEPPGLFENVRVAAWPEKTGAPQCLRRLALFHPDAQQMFGGFEWIVQMDTDMIALRTLDGVFRRDYDFRIFRGTASKRPYNGGLVMIRAGARPQVFEKFAANPALIASEARKRYVGSDQAVISYLLGPGERTWGEAEGVFYYSPRVIRLNGGMRAPPHNMRMLFFPGDVKPWNNRVKHEWMKAAWLGKPIVVKGGRARPQRLKIRAYRDDFNHGVELAKAAAKAGTFCTTFSRATAVNNGVAFVAMGSDAAKGKALVRELNDKSIVTIPTLREAELHENPTLQRSLLSKWTPPEGARCVEEYRVCVVGKYLYGERVKDHKPIDMLTPSDKRVARICADAANMLRAQWLSFSVATVDGAPRIIEVSCSWNVGAFAKCRMFERHSLRPSPRKAGDTFRAAVEAIKELWRRESAEAAA